MMKAGLLLCALLLLSGLVAAQDRRETTITGTLINAENRESLFGVNVIATSLADTTLSYGTSSNRVGLFTIGVPSLGLYRVRFTYVGVKPLVSEIAVTSSQFDFGIVRMENDVFTLDQVVVQAMRDRVVVRGDTTEYLADAFKVNPDATAEDLVAKMPGIVVQDGEVQAQGETVRRVTVDGREFFGDDPNLALRTLPSEIIERIQVFDRLSDQAEFTGFDDGNREMTMNIVTRPGRNVGQFGKVYGGYGSDDRYISGGNVNIFAQDRRISIIGLSNNVNQQNFSTEDLLGVVGNAGRRSGMGGGFRAAGGRGGAGGGRPGGGGAAGGGMRDGGGMAAARMGGDAGGMMSFNPGNFLTGNQGGLNTTHSVGVNYSDSWGSKVDVTGSYFFNLSDNTSDIVLERQYFLSGETSQLYDETNQATSDNFNHRVTMRMTYTIDDKNSIIFTPRISTQSNSSKSTLFGLNTLADLSELSRTTNDYVSDNSGYTGSGNLLFRHRFDKPGRTLSINLGGGLNDRTGTSDQYSSNVFTDGIAADQILDQRTNDNSNGVNLTTSLSYTEPLGAGGQLQLNYRPSWTNGDSYRLSDSYNPVTGKYDLLEPSLSSSFKNQTFTQRGGVGLSKRGTTMMITVGADVESVHLTGDQTFPRVYDVDKTFQNVLPNLTLQYNFSRSNNLRFSYRASTRNPSISQLQDVVNNTNPLQLSSGNPDLRQSYMHTFVLRYNRTTRLTGNVFIANVSFATTSDNIGNKSILATEEMVLDNGIVLAPGSQFTQPVNLDGYWNGRSFLTFGTPLRALKSNLNMNGGYSYTRTPTFINEVENISGVHNVNGGFVLGSNISERVDFTVSYSLNKSIIKNSVYAESDGNYLFHRSSVRLNLLPWNQIVFQTSLNNVQYVGLGKDFDSNSVLWNAGLGYKFLGGNGGEIKFMVADILNQNTNLVRTVNELYIEDNLSNTLGRYVILNFTYTLRNFGR